VEDIDFILLWFGVGIVSVFGLWMLTGNEYIAHGGTFAILAALYCVYRFIIRRD